MSKEVSNFPMYAEDMIKLASGYLGHKSWKNRNKKSRTKEKVGSNRP